MRHVGLRFSGLAASSPWAGQVGTQSRYCCPPLHLLQSHACWRATQLASRSSSSSSINSGSPCRGRHSGFGTAPLSSEAPRPWDELDGQALTVAAGRPALRLAPVRETNDKRGLVSPQEIGGRLSQERRACEGSNWSLESGACGLERRHDLLLLFFSP